MFDDFNITTCIYTATQLLKTACENEPICMNLHTSLVPTTDTQPNSPHKHPNVKVICRVPTSDKPELLQAPQALGKHFHSRSTFPQRENRYRHKKRAMKRKSNIELNGHRARKSTLFEHVQISSPIHTKLKTEELPTKHGAYGSLPLREPTSSTQRAYSLKELIANGFNVIEWDGM